jgi:LysM repeat protein
MPLAKLASAVTNRPALLLWTVILAFAFVMGSTVRVQGQQPDALDNALRDYVEQRGEEYAGPCDETVLEEDIGKWCSEMVSRTDNRAEAQFGPTFSQFVVAVTFERVDGEWQVVREDSPQAPGEPGQQTYRVEPGDTLFSIAQQFEVSVERLAEINDIDDPAQIEVGQLLVIPEGATEYTVRPGDTLFSIAQQFGVSVDELAERNNIDDPSRLEVGQVLIIPSGSGVNGDGNGNNNDVAVCRAGEGFVSSGNMPGRDGPPGDARQIFGFRAADHDGCARLVIDLGTAAGNQAQTAGPVFGEYLREQGLIRVHLGNEYSLQDMIDAPADQQIDTSLFDTAYVVWSQDGHPYVDVHLTEPVLARLIVVDSPARVVIDAQPETIVTSPATSDNVVVVQPRDNDVQSYPLVITGYGRTFEANVIARIYVDGEIQAETFTTAASWAETWGEFELVLDEGPLGEIELFVGEESAKDGTEQGVRVQLTMR